VTPGSALEVSNRAVDREVARARIIATLIAGTSYIAAIVLANWMLKHVGTLGVGGNHFAPVGFGLMAPSGVYAAAIAFPTRDIVQRSAGRLVGAVAIVIGATISWFVASPSLAIASGLTFLVSESVDFAVFAMFWRRWLVFAVLASGIASVLVDSSLFLRLVGIPWSVALAGQIVGKTWIILAALPIVFGLRRLPVLQFSSSR
jgi:uncharacterized PurR-regulated membrane protein YhhQ (DUF165 family)